MKITVALPLWNSGNIAWLCLRSLCEQKVGVEWELIIVEEQTDEMFGMENVLRFEYRLLAAGCMSIKYIPIEEKMSLCDKWRLIADVSNIESEVFVMCAADNYYQHLLLHDSWTAIGIKKYDWCQSHQCHFYDIDTGKLVEYRLKKLTGIEMAIKMSLARKIPKSDRRRGIDLFIYRSLTPKNVYWNIDTHCLKTVCTHGRNKISGTNRKNLINNIRAPFRKCHHSLGDVLPLEIINKLGSV